MPQGDIYKLVFVQSVNNTRITNVFYYEQTQPDGAADDQRDALASAFETNVAQNYSDQLAAGWSGLCYEISKVGVTGQQFFRVLSGVPDGQQPGHTINAAATALISLHRAEGGKGKVGHTYITGWPEDYEHRNNLTQDGLTAIDIIGDSLVGEITAMGTGFKGGVVLAESPGFAEWVVSDTRVPLTKLRPRRQSTRC